MEARINSRAGIAESYYNLGSAFEKIGQIDRALSYAWQSLALDKTMGNRYNLGLSYKKMASLN